MWVSCGHHVGLMWKSCAPHVGMREQTAEALLQFSHYAGPAAGEIVVRSAMGSLG